MEVPTQKKDRDKSMATLLGTVWAHHHLLCVLELFSLGGAFSLWLLYLRLPCRVGAGIGDQRARDPQLLPSLSCLPSP